MKTRFALGGLALLGFLMALAWLRADAAKDAVQDIESRANTARIQHITEGIEDAQSVQDLSGDDFRRELRSRVSGAGNGPE